MVVRSVKEARAWYWHLAVFKRGGGAFRHDAMGGRASRVWRFGVVVVQRHNLCCGSRWLGA